jgi:uncharacterized protein YjiS (DUF1127 family)
MSYLAAHESIRPSLVLKGLVAVASLKAIVLQWRQCYRSRTELAKLTERDWHDLGYSSCDVETELGKPFWIP